MGNTVTVMQRWDRHYDPWLACELGNLPVVRRAIDMGTVGVHDTNRITGETLLHVSATELHAFCAPSERVGPVCSPRRSRPVKVTLKWFRLF